MVRVKAHTRKTEGGKTVKVRAHNRRNNPNRNISVKTAERLDRIQNWLMSVAEENKSDFEDFLESMADLYGTKLDYHIWTPSTSEYYLVIEGPEIGELKLGFSYDQSILGSLSERFDLPAELLANKIPAELLGDYDRYSTLSFDDDYIWNEIERKMTQVRGG